MGSYIILSIHGGVSDWHNTRQYKRIDIYFEATSKKEVVITYLSAGFNYSAMPFLTLRIVRVLQIMNYGEITYV